MHFSASDCCACSRWFAAGGSVPPGTRKAPEDAFAARLPIPAEAQYGRESVLTNEATNGSRAIRTGATANIFFWKSRSELTD